MQIIGRKKISKAAKEHSDWRKSLNTWTTIVKEADWTCNSDVQQTFNTADPVAGYVIFNIAGNRARLEAIVNFPEKRVTVTNIMTHAEYTRKDYRK